VELLQMLARFVLASCFRAVCNSHEWVHSLACAARSTTLAGDDTESNVKRLCFKAKNAVQQDIMKDLELEDLNKIWHLVRFEFEPDWEAALEPGVQVEEDVFEVAVLTFNVITRVTCIIVAAGKIQERWLMSVLLTEKMLFTRKTATCNMHTSALLTCKTH